MSGHFVQTGMRKRELREHYKELRRKYEPQDKKNWDERILECFLELPEYRETPLLLCYVSMAREVDTYGLMRAAWRDGKRVAVPRTGQHKQMRFYEITSHRALVPRSFGIMEPDPTRSALLEEIYGGLCVVPGLAFDRQGYRLGYGGGYYDRFLDGFRGVSAGLCYEACFVDELVREEHDRRCDLVISEAGCLRIGRENGAK